LFASAAWRFVAVATGYNRAVRIFLGVALLASLTGCHGGRSGDRARVAVATASPIATVSDRFVSVAIDTAQLVGGDFWTPGVTAAGGLGRVTPFDFSRARLARLAAPLGHAYLRIGGTDADRTWFSPQDPPPAKPPAGYRWILTRDQLDRLGAFARALDFQILFTLNAGPGPRDHHGPWHDDNARALVEHATRANVPITVWELGNEVNGFLLMHGFWLSAAAYARDVRAARAMLAALAPTAKLAAPASAYWPIIGEVGGLLPAFAHAGGASVDLLTWHFYPQESARCPVAVRAASTSMLLDPEHLDEIDRWADDVEKARATDAPRAQAWLDETGNAQCGGAPGVSDAFVGSLWWLDELGKMARRGTPVVVRQSLTGADYGLLAEPSLDPRPDYFATVLWRKLMGTRVLATAVTGPSRLRTYAHCSATHPGAVVLLAINLDPRQPMTLSLDGAGGARTVWRVTADRLGARTARLEGRPLTVSAEGDLPPLGGSPERGGSLVVAPASYLFAELLDADAPACR
jgi:heparanase 1